MAKSLGQPAKKAITAVPVFSTEDSCGLWGMKRAQIVAGAPTGLVQGRGKSHGFGNDRYEPSLNRK